MSKTANKPSRSAPAQQGFDFQGKVVEPINQALSKVDPVVDKIEGFIKGSNDPVSTTVDKTITSLNISYRTALFGLVGLILMMLLVDNAFSILSLTVGVAYPTYRSFKAVESKSKDDDTQWLMYWVVFGFFSYLELFSDMILWWFPMYYVAKFALLVFCMIDTPRSGAGFLYRKVVRPFLVKHEAFVDDSARNFREAASDFVSEKNE